MTDEQELIAKFWSRVDVKHKKHCWEWKANLFNTGYGRFSIKYKDFLAHRISWLITNGDPKDLFVLHKCDNRRCVNPHHLFLGTSQDNNDDMRAKGRAVYVKGEHNGASKLTSKDVLDIRNSNEPTKVLTQKYGVSGRQIKRIKTRENWRHLP